MVSARRSFFLIFILRPWVLVLQPETLCWVLTSTLMDSYDGTSTRMLRTVLNISQQSLCSMKSCVKRSQQRLQQGDPAETRSLSSQLPAKTYPKGPDLVILEPLHRQRHCGLLLYTNLDDILKRDRGAASTAKLASLQLTRTLAHQSVPPWVNG